ncbi:MAG: serine/threonine protein kinase [Candidatus Wallbacteria bacterium]|nr:serine/threonine protein kinase [Candidatus Wallbacteria bacterium]
MGKRSRNLPLPEFSPAFLERFEEIEEIGSGGMARVFKARNKAINRPVAVKLIHPLAVRDAATLHRFVQEARITAALQHPNIIKILDTGEEGELPYLVFEFIEGRTLENRIRQEGKLSLADALGIAADVADALAYAHERGVIHRGLKPGNLLFTAEGVAKIADFGLAKLEDSSRRLTGIGFSVGTPGYMSPEQVLGNETDGRSDIYAVGVMLYEMLTGALPFPSHNDMNVMLARMQEPYPPLRSRRPDAPESAEELIAHALAFELEDRFQTARDLREAILDITKPDRSGRVKTKPVPRPRPSKPVAVQVRPAKAHTWRVPPWMWLSGLAAAVFLAAAAITSLRVGTPGGGGAYDASGVVAMPGLGSARVYWSSTAAYQASLRLWESGQPEAAAREYHETASRSKHDLTVAELKPGGSFQYRILYPDKTQSLLYGVRVPEGRTLEVQEPRLQSGPGGTALFTWQTNVPARCTLVYRAGNEKRQQVASRGYRRRHRIAVADYPLLQANASASLECQCLGGAGNAVFPVRSALEAASVLEQQAAKLDLTTLVGRFDSKVRVKHESPADLLPRPLLEAAGNFSGLAGAWFSEGLVARKLAFYHVLANLENVDAVWAAAGLELPFRAAALYRPFVTTDYPDGPPPGGKEFGADKLKGVTFRGLHAPQVLEKLSNDTPAGPTATVIKDSFRLSKEDLDAAERVWITLQTHNLDPENAFKVRLDGMVDLYFRPASVGYPGMASSGGSPASAPPARKATFVSHGVPAELLHPGPNELEVSYDSVPGVTALGHAAIRAAWVHLEKSK